MTPGGENLPIPDRQMGNAMKKVFILLGLALATCPSANFARPPQHSVETPKTHDLDYYTNVNGHSVHRPVRSQSQPSGATARCRDGTWSFSEHRRGTCSYHGGVATWLR